MVPTLETKRLILRPLELSDAPAIQHEFPHWEIVRLMNGMIPWPYPDDGAETYVRDIALPAVARGEAWHWSLRPKTSPVELIGVISLVEGEEENRGFWISQQWQRQGLMTEAADAVTDFWFDELGKQILRVPKAIDNEASRRISLSSGMRMVGVTSKRLVSGKQQVERWEITASEWHAYRGQAATTTKPS